MPKFRHKYPDGYSNRTTPEIRFWKKVLKTETCWEWQGALNEKGYGVFNTGNGNEQAHRYAFFLEHERFPFPMGLHKCDNPKCVRVDEKHVYEGSHSQNLADASLAGVRWGFARIKGGL